MVYTRVEQMFVIWVSKTIIRDHPLCLTWLALPLHEKNWNWGVALSMKGIQVIPTLGRCGALHRLKSRAERNEKGLVIVSSAQCLSWAALVLLSGSCPRTGLWRHSVLEERYQKGEALSLHWVCMPALVRHSCLTVEVTCPLNDSGHWVKSSMWLTMEKFPTEPLSEALSVQQ